MRKLSPLMQTNVCSTIGWTRDKHGTLKHAHGSWILYRVFARKQCILCFALRHKCCLTITIECFHSRGQYLCKFIGTKEGVCIRKEFNSQRIGLGHQHGRHFIVLGTPIWPPWRHVKTLYMLHRFEIFSAPGTIAHGSIRLSYGSLAVFTRLLVGNNNRVPYLKYF